MTYSTRLARRIPVAIEQLNNFQDAEFGAALHALPGYPEIPSAAEIRKLAAEGNEDAQAIIDIATETQEPSYLDYIE